MTTFAIEWAPHTLEFSYTHAQKLCYMFLDNV